MPSRCAAQRGGPPCLKVLQPERSCLILHSRLGLERDSAAAWLVGGWHGGGAYVPGRSSTPQAMQTPHCPMGGSRAALRVARAVQ